MAKTLHPRCDASTCVRCRRKFVPGDRVHVVNIVVKTGVNANNPKEFGAWLSDEFEIQHANCADTGLDGTIIVGNRV